MTKEQALELAAQAWCTPMTAHLAMQPEVAEAFADILIAQNKSVEFSRTDMTTKEEISHALSCAAHREKMYYQKFDEFLLDIPKQIRSGGSYTTGSGHTRRTTTALELVALNMTHDQDMTYDQVMPLILHVLANNADPISVATEEIKEAIRLTADQLAQDYVENM